VVATVIVGRFLYVAFPSAASLATSRRRVAAGAASLRAAYAPREDAWRVRLEDLAIVCSAAGFVAAYPVAGDGARRRAGLAQVDRQFRHPDPDLRDARPGA
jgi:hypothetical protein